MSRRIQRLNYGARREARLRALGEQEAVSCEHCEGTGQMLWRSPEIAGGVGEECTCEWCDGRGYVYRARKADAPATEQEVRFCKMCGQPRDADGNCPCGE